MPTGPRVLLNAAPQKTPLQTINTEKEKHKENVWFVLVSPPRLALLSFWKAEQGIF